MQSYLSDNVWFNLNFKPGSEVNIGGRIVHVPLLPSDDVQLRFTGRTTRQNLEQAFEFYKLILEQTTNLKSVVDFGGGWGRILRFFLRDVNPDQLYLIDCLTDAIDEARRTKAAFNIIQTIPGQPCPVADESIDVVYAFSVFSHLSETSSRQALRDFSRMLKKGGIAAITTRGRQHLDFLRNISLTSKTSGHLAHVSQVLPDWDVMERGFDKGEYQFFPTGGGGELSSDFYGEAWIGKNWIKANLSELGYTNYEIFPEKGSIDQVTFILHK